MRLTAVEGLQLVRSQDRRLTALSDRLWRFREIKLELLDRMRLGVGQDARFDSDPAIKPETRLERRTAVLQRIIRPVVGSDEVAPMLDAATALDISANEVTAETASEKAFLEAWKRTNG